VSERQQIAAKVDNEAARLAANVENEHKIASRRVTQLLSAVEAARAKSGAAEVAKVQLDQLLREAEASREIYTSVLKRLNETREQEALVEPDARMVSMASVPTAPSSPGVVLIAILGLLASTLIGTVLAMLLERLNQGLRSEDDVRKALALPRLSLVPRVRGGIPFHRQLMEMPFSPYAESIRLTLTALRFQPKPRQAEILMITSSVPEEGKTTLATSLAVAAASAGYKTMLMDCDFRHPSLLKVLSLPDHPGIVDHVTQQVPLADIVIDGPVNGLKLMAAGRLTVDPMPLLTGDTFRALLAAVRSDYEHVIIDTSPVLGISDAQNLARSVDKIVLVVHWNKTPGSIAANAAEILRKLDAPVAGVVMTQVDLGRHSQYDYGDVGDVFHKYRKYYAG
jgi:capsular exopolysaccharide synthesis family protein